MPRELALSNQKNLIFFFFFFFFLSLYFFQNVLSILGEAEHKPLYSEVQGLLRATGAETGPSWPPSLRGISNCPPPRPTPTLAGSKACHASVLCSFVSLVAPL